MAESVLMDLGEPAAGYARHQLALGRSLSKLLANRELRSAHYSAYVPSGTSKDRAMALDRGGLWPQPIEPADWAQGRFVQRVERPSEGDGILQITRALARSPRSLLILEHALASRGDSRYQTGPVLHYGDEVYLYATAGTPPDQVGATMRRAVTYRFLGALVPSPPIRLSLRSGGALNAADVQAIATGATLLLLGAYDGEGFLFVDFTGQAPLET